MTARGNSASRAVLFGVHSYEHFADLDGVRHNVPAVLGQLTDAGVGGFADGDCVGLPPDSTPLAVLDAVQSAAEEARDLLLVYYAGHGHFHRDGKSLLLSTRMSRPKSPHRSIPYAEVRAFVAESTAQHKIVIVDSCFSGVALHMDGPPRPSPTDELAIDGACVLTSAAETQRSLCVPEGSVFTLELVKLLRDGLTGSLRDGRRGEDQAFLTMADVFEALQVRLSGLRVEGWTVPKPRLATRDEGYRIPLARNRAFAGSAPPEVPRAPRTPHTAFAPSRHFTGREEEISELVRLAGTTPPVLCLVHGRSGQGKSELLRSAAARIAHQFPAGCLEVDLRGWTPDERPRDPYAVIEEQLRHLGYEPERIPGDPSARAEVWRLLLTTQRLLLLLDNARDARQLRPLLPGAGAQSVVLMSSRNELADLTVDWRHALAPLPKAECVTVWHKMGVPAGTRLLGELASGIHGSPNALGPIATALQRGASPTSLLASLTGPSPFRLLPHLDAAERAAFASANDALDPALRSLVRHCAWHPGPDFGPDSIAAMTELPEEEVDIQLTRIEQLLVRRDGRYAFHDLSRSYALAQVPGQTGDDTARASRLRLYEFLLGNLTTAHGTTRHGASGQGAEGIDSDVSVAHRWLGDHAQELSAAARTALEDGWGHAPEFLLELGRWLHLASHHAAAEETCRLLLSSLTRGTSASAEALRELGEVQRGQGLHDAALTSFQEARDIHRKVGDGLGEAHAVCGLGDVLLVQGGYARAAESYRYALTSYEELEDLPGEARATSGLGNVHHATGDHARAGAYRTKAVALYRALGDVRGQADATRTLGDIHRTQGRHSDASQAFGDALALYERLGDVRAQAGAGQSLGDSRYAVGRYTEAALAYQGALALYQDLGDRHGQAGAARGLADIDRAQARFAEAATAYEDALVLYGDLGDRHGQALTALRLADVHHAQGRFTEAADGYGFVLAACRQLGDGRGEATALYGLAHIEDLRGHRREAMDRIRSARRLFAELGLARLAGICDHALHDLQLSGPSLAG